MSSSDDEPNRAKIELATAGAPETDVPDAPVGAADSLAPAGEPSGDAKRSDESSDRFFLRLSILNTILAVAGVFTGAVALWAALQESEAVRKQSAAAVWPYVQLSTTDFVDDSGAYFSLTLTNAGIGPARIRSMFIRVRGEVVRDWTEMAAIALPDEPTPTWGQSFVVERVLRPGEAAELIGTRDVAFASALSKIAAAPDSEVTFCYCSIFDDCWLSVSSQQARRPEPVSQCPSFGADAFRY